MRSAGSTISQWVSTGAWLRAVPEHVWRADREHAGSSGQTSTRIDGGHRTEVTGDRTFVLAVGERDSILPPLAAAVRRLLGPTGSGSEPIAVREWLEGRDHLRGRFETARRSGDLLVLPQPLETWGSRIEGHAPGAPTTVCDDRVSVRVDERPR